jgi:hypothetical protein
VRAHLCPTSGVWSVLLQQKCRARVVALQEVGQVTIA